MYGHCAFIRRGCLGQSADSGFFCYLVTAGAEVTLSGDAVVRALLPRHFDTSCWGIQSHGPQVRLRKLQESCDSGSLQSAHARRQLTPKTRLKAAARSLFIPGWANATPTRREELRLQSAGAGSIAAFLLADEEFRYRRDLFRDVSQAYDSSKAAVQATTRCSVSRRSRG